VQALLFSHAPPSTDPSLDSISTRLAAVPLSVWESETPVLDSVIRETLRLAQSHAALRRNLGHEVHIDGKVVPTGAYVVYPFSDVHLDPELYPDPWKFDPSRPESKAAFGYVGWGGGMSLCTSQLVPPDQMVSNIGKTICLGTRLAKVELKLTTAMMLLGFSYGVVDKSGQPSPLPRPNWNDLLRCRPEDPCFVSYERTDMHL
jgi:cytochrome P450